MSGERVPNQRDHWERMYRAQQAAKAGQRTSPSAFARFCAGHVPEGSSILELGCGAGTDAAWFAQAGHDVTATDFSPVIIGRNQQQFPGLSNLTFRVVNTAHAFPFGDSQFDVVYAHLSLHYFGREVTARIFREIHRVLKPGGHLMFLCKSVADPLYELGTELEPDMYLHEGHIRHFFSDAFARECLGDRFTVDHLETGRSVLNQGRGESAWIRVIAHYRDTPSLPHTR